MSPIVSLSVEVARASEIPVGTTKRVRAFEEDIMLSNVGGKIYATQDECGHQRVSLSKGSLDGDVVTCALHGAKFDVSTGSNVTGIQPRPMPPELMEKIPPEIIASFQKTAQLLADIKIRPLRRYLVELRGDSVYLDKEA